jgi:hypothetical protein
VVLERDHRVSSGAVDPTGPDFIYSALTQLQTLAPTDFYDEQGQHYTAVVDEGISYSRVQISGRTWRTVARIQLRLRPA